MEYADKVKQSFTGMWKNKALWSVLILELILITLLGILFFVGDLAVLAYINKDALLLIGGEVDWHSFLNTKTYIIGALLLLVQGLIFVYLDSFFKSGFIGMAKNYVKDGSTTFAEFIPEAKRFWYPMFRLTLIRYAIFAVAGIPVFFTLLSVLGTTPQLVEPSQVVYAGVAIAIFAIVGVLVYFWFLYSEACIAFDDMDAVESIKASARMANNTIGQSVIIIIVVLAVYVAASAISTVILLPFDLALEFIGEPQTWLIIIHGIVKFLLNIFTIFATIMTTLFIFLVYHEMTVARSARKVPTAMPKTTIKRRK